MTLDKRRQPAPALIGLLIRNSTLKQVGNHRSEVQYDMGQVIERRGFLSRVYDEQGTSGKDLSVRTVTLGMLDDVDRGELRGIGAEDVKRLTRDEFGIDGGTIAKRLANAGALFVTRDKVYDLRNGDDLLQFQFQCFLSGIDWRNIRDTFWSGRIKALEKAPLFARPPLGYYSETVAIDDRGRPLKRAAKNPEQAAVLVELIDAFNECETLAAVLRRLRDRGVKRPVVHYDKKELEGWTAPGLRWVLNNKAYVGIFEEGGATRRDGKTPRSNVWHKFASDEDGQIRSFTHVLPELAYWAPSDVRRWKSKFSAPEGDVPARRDRRYPHPLLGVLVCNQCDELMVGNGPGSYICRNHAGTGCSRPQTLSEQVTVALLQTILEETLASVTDLAQEAEAQLVEDRPSADALRLAYLQERSEEMARMVATMKHPNQALYAELDRMQGEIDRLRDVVADETAARDEARQLTERLRLLQSAPLELVRRLPAEDVARVCALLFRQVKVGCEGRASAQRWWLAEYQPLFGEGLIRTLYPHTAIARMLPPAQAKKLAVDRLSVTLPEQAQWTRLGDDSAGGIKSYLSPLMALATALAA